MYEDVCREARIIDESVQAGDIDQLERFGSILDATLQGVQELQFRAEDFTDWPTFRDLLIKRRVQKFNAATSKRNKLVNLEQ